MSGTFDWLKPVNKQAHDWAEYAQRLSHVEWLAGVEFVTHWDHILVLLEERRDRHIDRAVRSHVDET